MKIYGVKRIWSSPIFLHLKKHYCPACNSKLKPTKVAKVVNSKSEEAKNFDFSAGDASFDDIHCLRLDLFTIARYNKLTDNQDFAEDIATASCL